MGNFSATGSSTTKGGSEDRDGEVSTPVSSSDSDVGIGSTVDLGFLDWEELPFASDDLRDLGEFDIISASLNINPVKQFENELNQSLFDGTITKIQLNQGRAWFPSKLL